MANLKHFKEIQNHKAIIIIIKNKNAGILQDGL